MTGIKRYFAAAGLLLISLSLMVLLNSCRKQNKLYTIGFVQIADDPGLNDARQGVIEALKEAGYEDGKNISIVYKNAQGDISNINLILKSFISDNVDMVMTNGTPCMVAAAQLIKKVPVVFTVAFSPGQMGIKNVPNVTGVYDPLGLKDFVSMIKQIRPEAVKLGIVFNNSEPNARFGRQKLLDECSRQNLQLIDIPIYSSNEVLQASEVLASKNVDAIVVAADNVVYMGLESVIKVSYKSKIPVFVTEPSQARRGALAGMGIDFSVWGKESGKLASEIIKGQPVSKLPIKGLEQRFLLINQKAARELGIILPEELVKRADEVYQ